MARKIFLDRVGEIMKAVLVELKNAGGQTRLKDLLARVEPKLKPSDYEKEPYAKSGYMSLPPMFGYLVQKKPYTTMEVRADDLSPAPSNPAR